MFLASTIKSELTILIAGRSDDAFATLTDFLIYN